MNQEPSVKALETVSIPLAMLKQLEMRHNLLQAEDLKNQLLGNEFKIFLELAMKDLGIKEPNLWSLNLAQGTFLKKQESKPA